MTLFAKVQNAVHYIANLSAEPCEDVFQYAEKVVTKAVEETDKFIFETIKPYCEAIEEREISKRDLECALRQYFHKEPCDDVISRQAVLDVLIPYCADDDGSVENTDDLRNALDDIESLPSVQPIRPKGKWERYGDTLKCPICRAIGENIKDSYCFNFCPNCGADMREVEK